MLNYDQLKELYDAANSDKTSKARTLARKTIRESEDTWVSEYLALPENIWLQGPYAGKLKYPEFGAVWAWVAMFGDPKANIPESDKLGTLLEHMRGKAAERNQTPSYAL